MFLPCGGAGPSSRTGGGGFGTVHLSTHYSPLTEQTCPSEDAARRQAASQKLALWPRVTSPAAHDDRDASQALWLTEDRSAPCERWRPRGHFEHAGPSSPHVPSSLKLAQRRLVLSLTTQGSQSCSDGDKPARRMLSKQSLAAGRTCRGGNTAARVRSCALHLQLRATRCVCRLQVTHVQSVRLYFESLLVASVVELSQLHCDLENTPAAAADDNVSVGEQT